jgi:hypothetical protein
MAWLLVGLIERNQGSLSSKAPQASVIQNPGSRLLRRTVLLAILISDLSTTLAPDPSKDLPMQDIFDAFEKSSDCVGGPPGKGAAGRGSGKSRLKAHLYTFGGRRALSAELGRKICVRLR